MVVFLNRAPLNSGSYYFISFEQVEGKKRAFVETPLLSNLHLDKLFPNKTHVVPNESTESRLLVLLLVSDAIPAPELICLAAMPLEGRGGARDGGSPEEEGSLVVGEVEEAEEDGGGRDWEDDGGFGIGGGMKEACPRLGWKTIDEVVRKQVVRVRQTRDRRPDKVSEPWLIQSSC